MSDNTIQKGRLVLEDLSDEQRQKVYNRIETAFAEILDALGANHEDMNFTETPARCARALMKDFTTETFELNEFDREPASSMITLPNHTLWTRCPHHLERIRMIVGISYIPRGERVIGLSKLIRLAEYLSKGCILQETYTRLLADELYEHLDPGGCAIYTEAYHQCMQARGVKTITPVIMIELRGVYRDSPMARDEFLRLVT
jgi:GTP cyclohydrolase I